MVFLRLVGPEKPPKTTLKPRLRLSRQPAQGRRIKGPYCQDSMPGFAHGLRFHQYGTHRLRNSQAVRSCGSPQAEAPESNRSADRHRSSPERRIWSGSGRAESLQSISPSRCWSRLSRRTSGLIDVAPTALGQCPDSVPAHAGSLAVCVLRLASIQTGSRDRQPGSRLALVRNNSRGPILGTGRKKSPARHLTGLSVETCVCRSRSWPRGKQCHALCGPLGRSQMLLGRENR